MRDVEVSELVARVGRALRELDLMLVTAESCTGGALAAALTDIPGSSGWFERGYITYSNRAKHELLGVPEATLRDQGAVSLETATAMAEGALHHAMAGAAIAITGIAGPDGGTPDKPVGTVCLACTLGHGVTRAWRCHFEGERQAIRRAAVVSALQGLNDLLEDSES